MVSPANSRGTISLRAVISMAILVGGVAFTANYVLSQDKNTTTNTAKKPPAAEETLPPNPAEKKAAIPLDKKTPAEDTQPTAEDKAEMVRMIKEMEELGAPNENHRFLESLAGNWNVVMKSWLDGPDQPATESKGLSQVKTILGGRYIVEDLSIEMLMVNPATDKEEKVTFQGQGLTGYDNYRNLYVNTWADNMSTQLLVCRGNRDFDGKILTLYGEMDEPAIGVRGRTVKYVTRIIDKDNRIFEMYDLFAGDNYKVMEIGYTRKK